MDPVTPSVVGGLTALEFGRLVVDHVGRKRDPLKRIEGIAEDGQREIDCLSACYQYKLVKTQRPKY